MGLSGVYQLTGEGKRLLGKWNNDVFPGPVYMFGIAVDDNGFLFSVTKLGSKGKCLLKFNHEIDFEDINVLSTTYTLLQ